MSFLDLCNSYNGCIDSENPELPPLSDPEQFDNVFLQSYSSGQPKFMRHYGDSVLRAMTFDIHTELIGKDNVITIVNTRSFTVSNAFYERLLLHYNLEKLCIHLQNFLGDSKSLTRKRGDVLEAYIVAIEMDISRGEEG